MDRIPDDPLQREKQGAILCQDWPGFGTAAPEHLFTADDLPSGPKLHGMIHFFFAWFLGGLWSLALDAQGELYFTEDQKIRKIDRSGAVRTVAGRVSPGNPDFSGDGDSLRVVRVQATGQPVKRAGDSR